MNAVARVLTRENFFGDSAINVDISSITLLTPLRAWTLLLVLIFSSLMLLYVKDINRCLFIKQQTAQIQNEKLQTEYNRLLLERRLLSTQSRVQLVAMRQLEMQPPEVKEVVYARS